MTVVAFTINERVSDVEVRHPDVTRVGIAPRERLAVVEFSGGGEVARYAFPFGTAVELVSALMAACEALQDPDSRMT